MAESDSIKVVPEIVLGIKEGELDPKADRFIIPGSLMYFIEKNSACTCYDLKGVKLLDWSLRHKLTTSVLSKAHIMSTPANSTERGRFKLAQALAKANNSGDPFIDFILMTETVIPAVAQVLGFGGAYFFEEDDWSIPSNVYVWNMSTVRSLTQPERDRVLVEIGTSFDSLEE